MKYKNVLNGLLMLCVSHAAIASSIKLDFIAELQRQMHVVSQKKTWRQFDPASTASIIEFITEESKDAYALNFKPGELPWQPMTVSGELVYYLADSNVIDVSNANGKLMPVDGMSSYIDTETPQSLAEVYNLSNKFMSERALYYLKHESVIDHQYARYMDNLYDGFNDPYLIKLTYLEDAALTIAQESDVNPSEEALRDAVAIHQYRNQYLSESAREFENGSEIMVGLPIYIGWQARDLNDADYRKFTQRTGCMPLNSMQGSTGMADCVSRGLPSFAASVYGRMLDKQYKNDDWKYHVEKEFKSISNVAIDFYHLTDHQAKEIAEHAMKEPKYQYARIEHLVDHAMLPYLSALEDAKRQLDAQTGVEVRTAYDLGSMFFLLSMFTDVFSNSYALNNHEMILQDITLIDEKNTGVDRIEFNHLPFITMYAYSKDFELDTEKSYTSFKVSDDAVLSLDGIEVKAADFVKQRKVQSFNKMKLSDSHVNLPINSEGRVDASDGVLKIVFDMTDGIKPFNSVRQQFAHKK